MNIISDDVMNIIWRVLFRLYLSLYESKKIKSISSFHVLISKSDTMSSLSIHNKSHCFTIHVLLIFFFNVMCFLAHHHYHHHLFSVVDSTVTTLSLS